MTLLIFLDNVIVWAPCILHYKEKFARGFAKKVLIMSQRQFRYGSNFYESDVIKDHIFRNDY